jgi:hypothetical protein
VSTERQAAIRDGVEEAMRSWMQDHDITTPEAIEVGIERAMTKWLDRNRDEIITAIATRAETR